MGTHIRPRQRDRTVAPFPIKSGRISRGAYCALVRREARCTWLPRLWRSPNLPFIHTQRDHQVRLLEAEANLSGMRQFALSGKIFSLLGWYSVGGKVGRSPLSQLELSGQVVSLRGRAVEGSDLCWVAGTAVARPGSHRDHSSPDHSTVGVGNQRGESTFPPSTSQNICRSAACPVTSGMAFPTGSYLLETTGAFISQEDFMLVLGVFFVVVVMILLVFFFFFPSQKFLIN